MPERTMPSNVPAPPMLATPVSSVAMSRRWSRSALMGGLGTDLQFCHRGQLYIMCSFDQSCRSKSCRWSLIMSVW